MQTENPDKLVEASDKPEVAELIAEFRRCSPYGAGWNRLSANDQTRFCQWAGQSLDGKKWDENMPEGKQAFPFDGASDARTFAIDEAIEEIVAVEYVAFFRAILKIQGVEVGDMEASGYVRKLLEWVIGTKQFQGLVDEVELHSQYTHTYGWSVLHVCWLEEKRLRLVEATMDQILAMAAEAAATGGQSPQAEILKALPVMILDPEQESTFVEVMSGLVPGLTPKRIRKMARDLREHGRAEVPTPMTLSSEPVIRALKPWEEVFISNTATSIQHARVFVKEWFTEVELRAMIATDGWSEDWIEKAVKEKGRASVFGDVPSGPSLPTGIRDGFSVYEAGTDLIEVLHCYLPQIDEEGIPGIYHTVLHPAIEDSYGKHELLDYRHGKMPFIVRKREHLSRTITSSRGLPEILYTTQRSAKVQEDSVIDSTSLSVMPPIIVPELAGVSYKFGPGQQLPEPVPGRAPRAMVFPTPGVPVAFELMKLLDRRINRRIGRRYADEDQTGADAQRQKLVAGNLASWSAAFQQEFQLLEQYMPAEEFSRITGAPGAPANDPESIARQYDFILTFDIRELSMDHVMEELKAIKDVVLPVDAMGVIDRGKLVELLLRAINPTLAKELIVNQQSATQAIFQRVKNDFVAMMAGFEPDYVEMDPTASAQLEFAKQLGSSNPRVAEALQRDERFRDLLEKWQRNRMQSIVQEQNKMVGRLGVSPG